jgi:hypothetical protein
MELNEYEMTFTKGVHQTYDMLKELDHVDNDEDFWKVFAAINTRYTQLSDAMHCYYTLLRQDGGDTDNCSLTQELRNGLYLLDEKYIAIHDKVAEVSPFSPN